MSEENTIFARITEIPEPTRKINPIVVIKKEDEFRPNSDVRDMQDDSELRVPCKAGKFYWVTQHIFTVSDNRSRFAYDFGYPHEVNEDGRRFSGNDGKGVDNWEVTCDTNRFNDLVAITHSDHSRKQRGLTLYGYCRPTEDGFITFKWSQSTMTDYKTGLMKGSTMIVYEATQ